MSDQAAKRQLIARVDAYLAERIEPGRPPKYGADDCVRAIVKHYESVGVENASELFIRDCILRFFHYETWPLYAELLT